MNTLNIKIKKLNDNSGLSLPSYATSDSAGMDLTADISENVVLAPGERKLVKTGLAIELPQGYEAQIRPRSGLAIKNGVTLVNAPGTIDADYRGEIGVILINHSADEFTITPGMRVAQMVIAKYERVSWNIVEELGESERGEGGFGSTGVESLKASNQ